MDLKGSRIDLVKREEGDWVDNINPLAGKLRIRTRGTGNKAFLRLQDKLFAALSRKDREQGVGLEERARIQLICLRDTCLLEWDGLLDGGKPVPYSKELADQFMDDPELEEFHEAVATAAGRVARKSQAELEADVKN